MAMLEPSQKITSGMLYSLGSGFGVGEFAGQLVNGVKYIGASASMMAYFADNGGGGKFTPMVAQHAADWIRGGLHNEALANERLKAGSWPGLARHYEKAKKAAGYHGHMGFLAGNLASSIEVVRRAVTAGSGRGVRTVGINETYYGYSYKIKDGVLRKNRKNPIPVIAYARRFEFGYSSGTKYGSQPARPFMAAGIMTFIQKKFPGWIDVVKNSIAEAVAKHTQYGGEGVAAVLQRSIATFDQGRVVHDFTNAIASFEFTVENYEKYLDKVFAKDGYLKTISDKMGTGMRDDLVDAVVRHAGKITEGSDPSLVLEIKQYAKGKAADFYPKRKKGKFDI